MTDASEIWTGPLSPVAEGGLARPRIGIGGISIESSTFSPHISGDEAFTERRGDVLLGYYPFMATGSELRESADWIPLLQARSLPGGAVARETYERLKAEILQGIREQGPFDAFYFDIHGAMSVVGMTDAEGDLGRAVREASGKLHPRHQLRNPATFAVWAGSAFTLRRAVAGMAAMTAAASARPPARSQ